MLLIDDIQALRDRVLDELNAAHDYFTDTKSAWHIVHNAIMSGYTFSVDNLVTGTVTTQADLLGKSRGYVASQLAEATFQQFISIFENFIADLLRLWLLAYPRSLSGKMVDFTTILDAPDKDAITLLVVNKEVNDVFYGRPAAWFEYLERRAKLGCPAADEIDRIAEAKASRDALVHNRAIAGNDYESKAGRYARYNVGQRIEIPDHYHRETWELIRKIAGDLSSAAAAKAHQ